MKQIAYLFDLIRFAFRHNPIIYVALSVSLGSVFLELAAMATLMPLAAVATGQSVSPDLLPIRWLAALGVAPEGQHLLLLFLAIFAIRIVTQFLGQVIILHTNKRLLQQLATNAFQTLLTEISIREVERKSIGFYISLVGDESFRASTLVANLSQLLSQLTLAALYYIAIFVYSPSAAIAVAGFLIVTMLLLYKAFQASHRLGHMQVEQSQAAGTVFLDGLNGLRSVKSLSAELFVSDSYRLLMKTYMRTLFRIDALNLLTRLGPALVLLVAATLFVLNPNFLGAQFREFGFAVTLIIFLMRFFPAVGQALNTTLRVVADARSVRDVTDLVRDHAPQQKLAVERTAVPPIEKIELRNVSFAYSLGNEVLSKVNLELRKGQSYAIIGRSGSGKSTLMDILLGFSSADEGEILVNSLPLTQYDAQSMRGRIVLVSQETTIFNDTVRNNVRFGMEISDQEIAWACDVAQASEFVDALPLGLDTTLNYRGTNLSGGQRQRIGIARALVRRPSVLLLDESTSALDSDTRNALIQALRKHWKDGILVFVTHDPTIINIVDVSIDMANVNPKLVLST
jgi:ABC-type bacteriocin/lantibiotic exporter with double-glycine peptidase domain